MQCKLFCPVPSEVRLHDFLPERLPSDSPYMPPVSHRADSPPEPCLHDPGPDMDCPPVLRGTD